jgi:Flp pilus assembly protein CpaB
VTTRVIPAGEPITPDSIRSEPIGAGSPLARTLLSYDQARGGRFVARHTIGEGESIPTSAAADKPDAGRRVVAIPVEREHAVGGDVDIGDRVDVIDYASNPARYVLKWAEVLARADGDGGLGSTGFWVTVAVTDRQALDVGDAVRNGKVMVVRSTAAPPPPEPSVEQPSPDGGDS